MVWQAPSGFLPVGAPLVVYRVVTSLVGLLLLAHALSSYVQAKLPMLPS